MTRVQRSGGEEIASASRPGPGDCTHVREVAPEFLDESDELRNFSLCQHVDLQIEKGAVLAVEALAPRGGENHRGGQERGEVDGHLKPRKRWRVDREGSMQPRRQPR